MKPTPIHCIILAALLTASTHQQAAAEVNEPDLYQRLAAASVKILVDGRLAGSGWFVDHEDETGLVVTAAHVLWPREDCQIVTPAGQRLNAEPIAWDRARDAVLLRVPDIDHHPALPLADKMPSPATRVFLFGSPQFRHNVMITGHVARDHPSYEYYADSNTYLQCYHISAPAPHGASGGCWVDETGRVVGLQSGMMRDSGGSAGIAFASDVAAIHQLLETRQNAANPTAGMAVEEIWEHSTDFIARHADHPNALVARAVVEDGPAHAAGVREMTLILAVDGQRLRLRDDFYNRMTRHAPGETMTLTILSPDDNQPGDVTLKLTSLEPD